jgi:3-(methylthio)propanoyl-CoA dehydrogenase
MARAAASSGSFGSDADFLATKRITAQHYALHVLPESGALRDGVVHGAVTTLGLNDAQF